MGFNVIQWRFLNRCFRETGLLINLKNLPRAKRIHKEEGYYGKKMFELGCQEIRKRVRKGLKSPQSGRSYFISIGMKVVSVDKTGCLNSIKMDLRKPLPSEYYNKFDIVTNFGTTEHIKPFEYQYNCFKNIHLSGKKGLVMIHFLPKKKKYLGHCQAYYTHDFFKLLAKYNKYKIIFIEDVKERATTSTIGVCLVKKYNNDFMEKNEIFIKYLNWVPKAKMLKHRGKIGLR